MRSDMIEEFGEEFTNEFDEEFNLSEDVPHVTTRKERLRSFVLGLADNRKFMYAIGFIDGVVTLAAIQYFFR